MLQFLLSSSSLNINWLIAPVVGLTAYNCPILFFLALAGIANARLYNMNLSKELLIFIFVLSVIGVSSAVMDGFTGMHNRQIGVFYIAAVCWLFVFETARRKDIMTMRNTKIILAVYFCYLVVVLIERSIYAQSWVAYLISNIFAPYTLANFGGYVTSGRLPYFSSEPSMAACAIAGVIMPYLVADWRVSRSFERLLLVLVACVVLYFAEGLTSRLLIAYTLGFVFIGEWAIVGTVGLMGVVLAYAFTSRDVIVDRSTFTNLLMGTFGGRSERIDAGLRSGSYISRLFNWFLGMRAFLDAPILGHGFGGTAVYLVRSVGGGTIDALVTSDQVGWYRGMLAPTNSQMLLRIPAEFGVVGTAFVLSYARRAWRMIFGPSISDRRTQIAFAYAAGAMLVVFILDGAYLNAIIPCFVALLGQVHRRRVEEGLARGLRTTPTPASLPGGAFGPVPAEA